MESADALGAFDLFVGLLLSHGEQSEPAILLNHFRLMLGQLLPEGYERPDDQTLERQVAAIPDTVPPDMGPEVDSILDLAGSMYSSYGKSEVIELRFLFAALLELPGSFQEALHTHLETVGWGSSEVSRTTQEYLASSGKEEDYARLLEERHPIDLRPAEIPTYQTDHGSQADLSRDLVGIRAEVDAFAYLLSSRDLRPPLAIGLFGDWGSGKSFFMEAVENRISKLTEIAREQDLAQQDVPFWKHIIQIRFNAWHYVEGELWASLVEHIFSQLKFDAEEDERLVEQRRQYWAKQITGKREELERLESQQQEKETERQQHVDEVERLRREREDEVNKLEELRTRDIADQAITKSLNQVRAVLQPHFAAAGIRTLGEALQSIQAAKQEVRQGQNVFRRLLEDRRSAVLAVAATGASTLVVWALDTIDVSPLVSGLSGLTAIVASVAGLVSRATGWVRTQLASLETAENAVLAEIEETRAAWNGEIQEVQGAILRVSQEIDENRAEQLRLSQELATLIEERDSITSVGLTNEFIAERTGSDDYRRLLGLPALIQRDFKMLSKLVREQNEDIVKHPGQEHANPVINRHVINRIVLYIDDLDRCPDQHVVEVLQAVHLLLAFDLFVVVVAVDARWLNHALVAHYPALVNDDGEGGQPTADDYLEKIFQIPFWIEPLVDAAKCRIVGGLLRPQLAGGGDGGGDLQPAGAPLKVEESQAAILDSIEDRTEPLSLNASDLSVSPEELEFLDSLAPLLGGTPRGIKRFVNLYQLLRIIHRVDSTEPQLDPTDEELLAFVLAVGDGLPRLAELLFATLSESLTDSANGPNQGQCLSGALAGLELVPLREQKARLEEWLATRPSIQAVTCSRLAPIARLAERFLFRVGGRTVVDSSGSE